MRIFNLKFIISGLALFFGLSGAGFVSAQAVCPVCVVAIAGGLGFSRWLGVDDLVFSVWIGAALLTLVILTIHWLKKKNWNFRFSGTITFLFYYVLTFISLYYIGIVGHPQNTILGIDKIIFGSIAGTFALALSLKLHSFLKLKNNNKSYFPYQRVAIPVAALILNSLLFYLLIIWKII